MPHQVLQLAAIFIKKKKTLEVFVEYVNFYKMILFKQIMAPQFILLAFFTCITKQRGQII